MPSDVDKLRDLARKENLRLADEKKRKCDAITDDARRLAKEDLPRWVRSIELAMHRAETRDSCYAVFSLEQVQHLLLSWTDSLGWYHRWRDENRDIAPSIDLDRICDWRFKSDIDGADIYTQELTQMLGEPFRLYHTYAGVNDNDEYHYEHFTIWWKERGG